MRGLIKPRDSKLIFRVKILPEKSTDHQIWYLILMPGQFSTCKRPPIKKGYSLQLLVSISDPVNGFIKISAILRDVILFAALQNFLHYHKHHTWNTAETCEMCESWNQKMNWKLQGKSVLFFFDLFSSLTTPTCLIFYQQWRIAALFSFVFFADFIQEKKHSHTLAMSNLITIRKYKHLKKTQFHTLARNAFVVLSQQCEIFVFAAITQLSKRRHL